MSFDESAWSDFAVNLRFAGSGFTVDDPGELIDVLRDVRHNFGSGYDIVHYLAVPPVTFADYAQAIEAHGLVRSAKVVFEKPYGTSLENFESLDRIVHTVFDESQVFRIDHFLGKEATQNLRVARFDNVLLSNVWDRHHVEAVQIDIPETLGIDDRAEFYDATGALKDMVVTHLFQLVAEVAMEQPSTFETEDVERAREAAIAAIRPLRTEEVVLGQFEGYDEVDGVANDSQQNTYVAARLWVDTDRWRGVPFLLRTGKRMTKSSERVTLIFRRPENAPYGRPESPAGIAFDLAGGGAIEIVMTIESPGEVDTQTSVTMRSDFSSLDGVTPLQPYERLLLDVLRNERIRFTSAAGLRDTWRVIAPIEQAYPRPVLYEQGSWGPAAGGELAEPYGWVAGR